VNKNSLILLITLLTLHIAASPVKAQSMSNENYILRTDNLDTVSSTTTEDNKLENTIEKQDPTISEGVNFKAKAGFENLTSSLPFSISLSSDTVDFGLLSPTNPIIRTIDLNIYSLNSYGYTVLVFENEPLSTTSQTNKIIIPNTTCDNGGCGTEVTDKWTNTLTYGFGYRCDNLIGSDCSNSFAKADYYKHFPDASSDDDVQSIMSGIGSDNKRIRVSYKVNISGTQAQGNYNNVITNIAVPNF
jgi:hypothetical protein